MKRRYSENSLSISKVGKNKKGISKKVLLRLAAQAQMLFLSSVVAADPDTIATFSIEQQPLTSALQQFAQQAGIQVFFSEADTSAKHSGAVTGDMPIEQALQILLDKSQLKYEYSSDNTVVIRRVSSKGKKEQSSVDVGERFVFEEVVVTATRREKNLQDIPMSVNAFSEDRLQASGIEGVQDVPFLAAGLHVANQNGLMRVIVRGVGTAQLGLGAEDGAAVHRDGIFLAQRQDRGMGFFDVDRIEVLRGPQGTLYGRNATGGAVNIITKAPTRAFEAGGSLTYGNYDLVETEGYASGPLVDDTVLARVAFKTRRNNGYTPNLFNGDSLDNEDLAALRFRLLYEPTENFNIDTSMDFGRDNGRPMFVAKRGRFGDPLTVETQGSILPSGRKVNLNDDIINHKESWGVGIKVEWDLNRVTMTSLTSYREFNWFESIDLDGGDRSVFFIKGEDRATKQVSQELTLASASDSNLEWVAGAFYFHGDESQSSELPLPSPPFETTILGRIPEYKSDAYALFGEASYAMLDELTITIGARYSYEEKFIHEVSTFREETSSDQLEDSWHSFTPKVALTYAISDEIFSYATVGQGFKSGSFNGGALQGKAYDPEEVTNYEIGLKTSLFGGHLRTNIALFHMDYSNMQVLVRRENPQTGVFVNLTDNAASSIIRGVELELQTQPTDSFSLDSNISYLHAKFDKWPDAIDAARGGSEFDVSDNQLPNAPEWAVNLGANYTFAIGESWSATLRGEYSHRSRVFFTPFEDEFQSQEGVGLANARLTFEHMDGKWSIAGWVKNITDELVANHREEIVSVITGRRDIPNYQPPRTYGVTISYRLLR